MRFRHNSHCRDEVREGVTLLFRRQPLSRKACRMPKCIFLGQKKEESKICDASAFVGDFSVTLLL